MSHILIVEDDARIRANLRYQLEEAGHRVDAAPSAEEDAWRSEGLHTLSSPGLERDREHQLIVEVQRRRVELDLDVEPGVFHPQPPALGIELPHERLDPAEPGLDTLLGERGNLAPRITPVQDDAVSPRRDPEPPP